MKLKLAISLLSLTLLGCLENEIRLSRAQLNVVDSLYLSERKLLDETIQDSCASLRAEYFDYWVDSMKTDRLRDIQKILGK